MKVLFVITLTLLTSLVVSAQTSFEESEELKSYCEEISYVNFKKIRGENGDEVLQRFIKITSEGEETLEVPCSLFGFEPKKIDEEFLLQTEELDFDKEAACRTQKEQMSMAAILNMKSQLDPIVNRIGCLEEEKTTTLKCVGEFACGLSSVSSTIIGIPSLIEVKLKDSFGLDSEQCSLSNVGKGLGGCFRDLLWGMFKSLKDLWQFGKTALTWIKEKTWDSWFSSDTVNENENQTSDAALMASNQNDEQLEQYESSFGDWFKGIFSSLSNLVTEGIKSNFGCTKWEGTAHLSKCLEPLPSFECATCNQRLQMTCGVIGYLASEAILIPTLTAGTAGLGAAVIGKIAANVGSKFAMTSKGVKALKNMGRTTASLKVTKGLVTVGSGVIKVGAKTFELLGKIPVVGHIGRGFFKLDELATKFAWNASFHGTKGLMKGGISGAVKSIKAAEVASEYNKLTHLYSELAHAKKSGASSKALDLSQDIIQARKVYFTKLTGGNGELTKSLLEQVGDSNSKLEFLRFYLSKNEMDMVLPSNRDEVFRILQNKDERLSFAGQLSDKERIEFAQSIAGKKFNEEEQKIILNAHNVGKGDVGLDGLSPAALENYTLSQIRKKREILEPLVQSGKLTSAQVRTLMETGVTGFSNAMKLFNGTMLALGALDGGIDDFGEALQFAVGANMAMDGATGKKGVASDLTAISGGMMVANYGIDNGGIMGALQYGMGLNLMLDGALNADNIARIKSLIKSGKADPTKIEKIIKKIDLKPLSERKAFVLGDIGVFKTGTSYDGKLRAFNHHGEHILPASVSHSNFVDGSRKIVVYRTSGGYDGKLRAVNLEGKSILPDGINHENLKDVSNEMLAYKAYESESKFYNHYELKIVDAQGNELLGTRVPSDALIKLSDNNIAVYKKYISSDNSYNSFHKLEAVTLKSKGKNIIPQGIDAKNFLDASDEFVVYRQYNHGESNYSSKMELRAVNSKGKSIIPDGVQADSLVKVTDNYVVYKEYVRKTDASSGEYLIRIVDKDGKQVLKIDIENDDVLHLSNDFITFKKYVRPEGSSYGRTEVRAIRLDGSNILDDGIENKDIIGYSQKSIVYKKYVRPEGSSYGRTEVRVVTLDGKNVIPEGIDVDSLVGFSDNIVAYKKRHDYSTSLKAINTDGKQLIEEDIGPDGLIGISDNLIYVRESKGYSSKTFAFNSRGEKVFDSSNGVVLSRAEVASVSDGSLQLDQISNSLKSVTDKAQAQSILEKVYPQLQSKDDILNFYTNGVLSNDSLDDVFEAAFAQSSNKLVNSKLTIEEAYKLVGPYSFKNKAHQKEVFANLIKGLDHDELSVDELINIIKVNRSQRFGVHPFSDAKNNFFIEKLFKRMEKPAKRIETLKEIKRASYAIDFDDYILNNPHQLLGDEIVISKSKEVIELLSNPGKEKFAHVYMKNPKADIATVYSLVNDPYSSDVVGFYKKYASRYTEELPLSFLEEVESRSHLYEILQIMKRTAPEAYNQNLDEIYELVSRKVSESYNSDAQGFLLRLTVSESQNSSDLNWFFKKAETDKKIRRAINDSYGSQWQLGYDKINYDYSDVVGWLPQVSNGDLKRLLIGKVLDQVQTPAQFKQLDIGWMMRLNADADFMTKYKATKERLGL